MASTTPNRKRKNKFDDNPLVFPDKLCIKYLNQWIDDSNANPNALIHMYNFYAKPPHEVYAEIEDCEENGGAYLLCYRQKKDESEKSNIPKRNLAAGEGCWSTKGGNPKEVMRDGVAIGYTQILSFFLGDVKQDFLAHEYTQHSPSWTESFDSKALYRLYKSQRSGNKRSIIQEQDEGGEDKESVKGEIEEQRKGDGKTVVGMVKERECGELDKKLYGDSYADTLLLPDKINEPVLALSEIVNPPGQLVEGENTTSRKTDMRETGEEERDTNGLMIEEEGVKESIEMDQQNEVNKETLVGMIGEKEIGGWDDFFNDSITSSFLSDELVEAAMDLYKKLYPSEPLVDEGEDQKKQQDR